MLDLIVSRLPNLITVFLGIFLEASPFLLLGVLVSSILEVAVARERLTRVFPRNGLLALAGGVAMGAAAPLCECGTVPIARRSVSRGLPLPAAIGFLLAAPVINPITVVATYTAFRYDLRILALRILLGVAVALAVGSLFLLWPVTESPLRASVEPHQHDHGDRPQARWLAVLEEAGSELKTLIVYLVAAAGVAAALQVFLPRAQLLSVGQGALLSVVIMMLVAVVLSTCSSVDAFVALAFSTTFSPGAILAFLLISPVLNLKSAALVTGLFRPQVALVLLSTATASIVLAALAVNYRVL